jgi:hypothetical protein
MKKNTTTRNTKSVTFDKSNRQPLNSENLIIHLNRIKLNESKRDVFRKKVKNLFRTRFKRFDVCFFVLRVLIIVILVYIYS